MALFRRRRTPGPVGPKDAERAAVEHLRQFTQTRQGVEAYIEPVTNVTQTTLVLVAVTGEWTRRRVPDARTARSIAQSLAIPVYDVQLTGYPSRMREWSSRKKG